MRPLIKSELSRETIYFHESPSHIGDDRAKQTSTQGGIHIRVNPTLSPSSWCCCQQAAVEVFRWAGVQVVQCRTVQYSTVQCRWSTVQYSTVLVGHYSTVQCRWCSTVQYTVQSRPVDYPCSWLLAVGEREECLYPNLPLWTVVGGDPPLSTAM